MKLIEQFYPEYHYIYSVSGYFEPKHNTWGKITEIVTYQTWKKAMPNFQKYYNELTKFNKNNKCDWTNVSFNNRFYYKLEGNLNCGQFIAKENTFDA